MRCRLRGALCAIAAFGLARAAAPQVPETQVWKLSGHYLNRFTRSRTVVPPSQRFGVDLNRLRLKLDASLTRNLGLEVQYDHEVLVGSYLKTAQYALSTARVETSFDLEREYLTRDELVARHSLYRALVTWSGRSTDVTIGRQRIALGTGVFWSPLDLLSPIDPTRLERDYRIAADAVLVEQKLGALGRFAGMYVPSSGRTRSTAAGYLHGNVRGTDYSVLAGSFRGGKAIGMDFSSSVGGLGLRGEGTITRPVAGPHYARILLGADYGFANSLTATAEAYYNGQGAANTARYDWPALFAGRVLSLSRWYGAMAATYEVTPLVKAAGYVVLNVDDGSAVLWPRVEWSVRTNLDLIVGVQRFIGGERSEYGTLNNLLHSEVRWFF